jgi:hypothetical protein
MTTWVYRFTGNVHFPEPVHEIATLAALDEECEGAWLMISARADPPGKGAAPGDEFLLCADGGDGLRLHGRAIVRGGIELRPEAPASVRSLYSGHPNRMYLPLQQVELVKPAPVPGLSDEEVRRFTSGQSYVKKIAPERTIVERLRTCTQPEQPIHPYSVALSGSRWSRRSETDPVAALKLIHRYRPEVCPAGAAGASAGGCSAWIRCSWVTAR